MMKSNLNKFAVMILTVSSATLCFSQNLKDAVLTVDQLILLDAKQAAQKAEEEASKTGLLQQSAGSKSPGQKSEVILVKPAPKWIVKNIYGIADNARADVFVDSHQAMGSGVGTVINGCVIKSIAGQCLTVEPVEITSGVGAKKKLSKSKVPMCPKVACWTGIETANEINPPQVTPDVLPNNQQKAFPLPMPLPK